MNKELLTSINKHWQILVALVFLLGYITLSFYFNMNGLPFIPVEIPLVVGLGLIVLIYVSIIYLFSTTTDNQLIDRCVFSLVLVLSLAILDDFLYYVPFLFLFLFLFFPRKTISYFDAKPDDIQSKAEEIQKNQSVTICKTILFLFSLYFMFIFTKHWTYFILYLTTLAFTNAISVTYKLTSSIKYLNILAVTILFPFVIALNINSQGFMPLNLYKQKVEFKTNKQSFSSIMVYQNTDVIYILDKNNIISISKNKITSEIKYLEYHRDNTPLTEDLSRIQEYFIRLYNE